MEPAGQQRPAAAARRRSSSARAEVVQRRRRCSRRAGRRRCPSGCPVSPGCSVFEGVLDAFGDLARVGAGELLDHEHEPGPPSTTASPISGWWSTLMSATSESRSRPPVPATGTSPSSPGSAIFSIRCRTCRRCCGVSMKPPVPGVDASRKVSGETTWALPAVSTTWLRVTPCRRSRSGSTCTCSCWSRMPQIETLATPGTPISRGRITHRAMTDCSIGGQLGREGRSSAPGSTTTAAAAASGGFDTCGSACAWVSRSSTSCRAR